MTLAIHTGAKLESEAMMNLPASPNNELENRQDEVHAAGAGTEPQSLRGSLHP